MPDDLNLATEVDAADDIRSLLTNAIAGSDEGAGSDETSAKTSDRARGPDGKFVSADTEAAPAEATDPASAVEPAPVEQPVEPPPVSDVEPPKNWSEADKAKFAAMPEDARKWVLDRHKSMEADYTRKTMEIADFKREYEPIRQLIDPFKPQLQQAGYTPDRYIREWINVEQRLMNGDGVGVIMDVMRGYNIQPDKVLQALGIQPSQAQGQVPQAPLDPHLQSMAQKLAGLEGYLQEQARREQAAAQQRQQAEVSRVTNEIEAFRTATDDKGAPLHPHYDDLESTIANLAQVERANGRVPVLKDLYDTAVWANPATRSKQQAAAQAAQQAKEQEAARAKAAAARKAGSSVTGAPSTGQTPKPIASGKSLRDTILEAAEDAA